MGDQEWSENQLPWRAGNPHGYRLLSRSGPDAVTVQFDGPRIKLLRWYWQNHYGRDWSPGDGEWIIGRGYTNSFTLTREELARLTELAANPDL